uniref:Cubilin n=1 Tax=Magallana gigas TaxID=29159 RepID=K1R8M5_MAGGI
MYCLYVSLSFYHGATTGAQVTPVCGTARSGRMFVSSGPAALLRLTSDYSIQQAGFTMRYIMTKTDDHGGCGTATSLTATSTVQYITNKQWPDSYDENSLCRWTITSSSGGKVSMTILFSDMLSGEECFSDTLEIFDGANTGAQVTSVCGTARSGRMFVSSGPAALLRLTSDYSIQQAGFTMRYIMTKTDDHGGCGTATTLTATTNTVQYITNKQWPDSYDENSLCRWTITSSSGGKVSMTILFSDMLSGEECYSDTLEIFDGSSRTDPSLTQGYFCDSRAVTTTQAPTTTTTQPPNEVCSSGTVQLTANNDTQLIQSPSYPIFYSPNMLCSWLITAPTGALIQLKVIDSYLEDTDGCVGDYVHIHDGSNADSAVIATYCGEISSSVNSTSNRLYIQFRTDGSVGQRGFQLEYTVLYDYSTPSCAPPAGVTNLEANATAQYFESPNYPDNYNSSSTFYWLIHNPSDTGYIRLEVEDSRIEADPYCTYDKVTVYRGPCTTYPILSSFCGVEKPTVTQYTGSYVLVVFTTDATADFRGFRIKYYVTTEVEKTSTFWRDVALIAGATIAGIAAVAIIVGLAVAAKKGKLPGMKSSGPKKRRLSVSSLSSSSSSSDESDKESSNKRKRPKTALRSKTKVRLPPVKSAKVETLPKVSIKGQSKLPPIAKK